MAIITTTANSHMFKNTAQNLISHQSNLLKLETTINMSNYDDMKKTNKCPMQNTYLKKTS